MCAETIIDWDPLSGAAFDFGPAVLAIGIFDGLHLGHRELLAAAREDARVHAAALLVVTFTRDPDEVFAAGSERFDKLLDNATRVRMLAEYSHATVLSLPISQGVLALSPDAFLDALAGICTPVAFHVGSDFRFGNRASGTVADLGRWGSTHGCVCCPHALVEAEGGAVTATRIRSLLRAGAVKEASALLDGRMHSVRGRVVHGRGAGNALGFATANLDLSDNVVLLPKEGVYGGYATVEGKRYPAAINVGRARSFADATAPLEAHLLDYEGDLYDRTIRISFAQWLRGPRTFASQAELQACVNANIEWVREHLEEAR